MTQFRTAAHLASWAGVCPGHNESAGKIKSSHSRPGNTHLKGALGIAAMAAVRTNGTMFEDLGSDHFQRTHRRTTERHALSQLHQLGYDVQLIPTAQTT